MLGKRTIEMATVEPTIHKLTVSLQELGTFCMDVAQAFDSIE